MAPLWPGDRGGCLRNELPFGLGDPLVFVDLGVLVFLLIKLIFLHLLDVLGVDRTTLLVAPLTLAAAWGGRLVLAVHPLDLGDHVVQVSCDQPSPGPPLCEHRSKGTCGC